jgi:hypothetical protein
MLSQALRDPVADGVNVTVISQLPPAATSGKQLLI